MGECSENGYELLREEVDLLSSGFPIGRKKLSPGKYEFDNNNNKKWRFFMIFYDFESQHYSCVSNDK